jgi:hypothetical protein
MATPQEHVQNAAEAVKSSMAEQKDSAASSLGNLAGALRKAAHDSGGGDQATTRIVGLAADGLESVATTLRSNDLDGMVRQVQSFARNQPLAFFFAAAAAGFLATRFLKAGAGPADSRQGESPPNPTSL